MKYSDSEEFKRLKYDFGEGKIKKDEAAMFLKQRCNSLSDEVMDREEYLKCLGILSEDVGYFYSEDERLTFMYNYNGELCRRSNRNDIIAYFDRYARGFSDTYILRIINKPSNPKSYRTQESDEIDRQIKNVIIDYNEEMNKTDSKRERLLKLIYVAIAAAGVISFGGAGYVMAQGVDATSINAVVSFLAAGGCSGFAIAKLEDKGVGDLVFKKKEKKK